jgi:DNA-binding MarR family transcriptional regulator
LSGEGVFEHGEELGPLRGLSGLFNDSALRSSVRLLILISLALNKKLSFVDLLELTGVGKGSLSNHLERLSSTGYVKTRIVPTLSGPRLVAEITEKGMDTYKVYLDLVEKIRAAKISEESQQGVSGSPSKTNLLVCPLIKNEPLYAHWLNAF